MEGEDKYLINKGENMKITIDITAEEVLKIIDYKSSVPTAQVNIKHVAQSLHKAIDNTRINSSFEVLTEK